MSLSGYVQTTACLLLATCTVAQTARGRAATTPRAEELHAYIEPAADAMHKGDLARAAQDLRRAFEIDSRSLAALNNLGIVLAREGKPAEAIPLYQRR